MLSWPRKRAITQAEHQAILDREQNHERKAFYQLAWHLGASQTDIALLEAENIDWQTRLISFARKKTGSGPSRCFVSLAFSTSRRTRHLNIPEST
jgi:integrase